MNNLNEVDLEFKLTKSNKKLKELSCTHLNLFAIQVDEIHEMLPIFQG